MKGIVIPEEPAKIIERFLDDTIDLSYNDPAHLQAYAMFFADIRKHLSQAYQDHLNNVAWQFPVESSQKDKDDYVRNRKKWQ